MSIIQERKFKSVGHFFAKFFGIFRGPTFISTFLKTPPLFREKILLAVSTTNSCAA